MSLIQIDNQRLDEIVESAVKFTSDPLVEKDIAELLDARRQIDEAFKRVQAQFKEKFISGEMENSIEGDLVKVVVSQSGSIYKMIDELAISPELVRIELDSKKVQDWVDKNESLPEGVEYNDSRGIAIRIGVK